MSKQIIPVPDIGGSANVDVIEVCVAPGDMVAAEDSLIVLESEKASMEVPSPVAGRVISVLVKDGDSVAEGAPIVEIETEDEVAEVASPSAPELVPTPAAAAPEAATGSSAEELVRVPDIGGSEGVDVIEICVAVGDEVSEGDSLVVLESDKASMEVPSPFSGKVVSLGMSEGDKVSMGDAVATLLVASSGSPKAAAPEAQAPKAAAEPVSVSSELDVAVPDIGGAEDVEVIDVCVSVGDSVAEGDSIVVLESDKASMEIPSPASGTVVAIQIKTGEKASKGTPVLTLKTESTAAASAPVAASATAQASVKAPAPAAKAAPPKAAPASASGGLVYAGPAVRLLARELGVDLTLVPSTGPKGRILKDDVHAYVKSVMQQQKDSPKGVSGGSGIPAIPEIDFSQFGEIELKKMTKIGKLTAANMSRNWLNVPHVTQFDDVDITELEAFRNSMKAEAEKAGARLTPLPFLLKACAAALRANPKFNVSLHADGEHIVQKNYVHIGVAVDTPNGLMVPVLRNVDQKGLYELARETIELAGKARDGKLMPKDMQGGCFTISSLGPIGGTGFTPIVNAPEVAILGVSKASIKPVWNGSEFEPRQMLPLSLSYDHRAINGADAGKFFTYLGSVLADLRRLII